MHPVFSESFHFQTVHHCLRMRLQPLTIGHLALLHEASSPFVTYARDINRDDLVFAVGCCAQPYEAAAATEPPGLIERLKFEWVTWRWGRAIRGLDLAKECDLFSDYLVFHRRFPDTQPTKGKARQLNSPSEWRLISMLMENHGMSWREAMNTPVLRAHALWVTRGDREGWLELWPNDPLSEARDKEFRDWARQEDERLFGEKPNTNN